MSQRAEKQRTLENCIPAILLHNTFLIHALGAEDKEKGDLNKAIEACGDAIKQYLDVGPEFYKDSIQKKAKAITKRVYQNYFYKNKFNTSKVFMLLHSWIHWLASEDLIDIYNEEYMNTLEDLSRIYNRGFEEGSNALDGGVFSSDEMVKKYKSADKHVLKFHNLLVKEGVY